MASRPQYRTVAYYVNWAIYARDHQPQSLPAARLTHCLYAFADVQPAGHVVLSDPWADTDKHYPSDSWNDAGANLYGCFKQLYLLKKRHRHFKVLLSIGGWTYSPHFAAPCSTDRGRRAFARSAVRLLQDLGLDGIDIDWEYPSTPAQAQYHLLLLAAVRAELDAHAATLPCTPRPRFLLTIAAPAGPSVHRTLDLAAVARNLDFLNLMAYDFSGPWDPLAAHHANLFPSPAHPPATPFSADAAVQAYLAAGVPRAKIVLGMPLYGRAFCATDGLGTAYAGVGDGSWEPGVWDYKIENRSRRDRGADAEDQALPRPGAVEDCDDAAVASCSYDAGSRTLVSYDTAAVAVDKAHYVRDARLGGAMWWESSGDKAVGEGSLIALVADGLGGFEGRGLDRSLNWLEYPLSKYDNVRAGMSGE